MESKDILAITLALFGIILSLTKQDYSTLLLLIILTISVIIITILINYIKDIEKNKNEINKLKEKLKIIERLNKLELKVFKNE